MVGLKTTKPAPEILAAARARGVLALTAKEKIRLLQRKLFYIWMFLSQEGLEEDAEEYVKNHMDEPTPFEDEW